MQETTLLMEPISFTEVRCFQLAYLASLSCSENKSRWPVIKLVLA